MKIKYREVSASMKEMSMPTEDKKEDGKKRSSLNSVVEAVEHYNIDVSKLIPFKKQARKTFNDEEINVLAKSIADFGLRQPLTVIKSEENPGFYEVISGERRLRACLLLDMNKVPCIISKNDKHSEEIALIENLQRVDLTPLEMGEAFAAFLDQRKGMKQKDLSEIIGISSKIISERLILSKLSEEKKDYIRKNNIVKRQELRKLVNSKDNNGILSNSEKLYSVLRIEMVDGCYIKKLKKISTLSHDEKQKLKKILLEIANEIE